MLDEEPLKHGLPRGDVLDARLAEAQERSRVLIERAIVNLAQTAERRVETRALRTEGDQLKLALRKAVSDYVLVLKAMEVQPERMLVLVKSLVDTPSLAPGLTARELREDLVRVAIEAYYAA
jgi:hypothetical protein